MDFRATAPSAVAPFDEAAGALGDIVVHGQDIARSLGLDPRRPSREAAQIGAEFLDRKDFAVSSSTLVNWQRLEAAGDSVAVGESPPVRGALRDLVMAMASRPSVLDAPEGKASRCWLAAD
ncbi:hypothetical protein [Brachybacterium vulturis]|uniref:hypothetical protein n=1 Tax=Brachybacterium vulturis TaxID=2017484 RepID=UPI003734F649